LHRAKIILHESVVETSRISLQSNQAAKSTPEVLVSEAKLSSKDLYKQLRESIINFELYPGTRVTESELAAQYGVSRTPIRGALQRLETEGYLRILPKQGCFIRNLDIAELAHYYQVRITLEMLSLQLAAEFMSTADLETLARSWDPARQEERSNDAEEMEARDESFHMTLAEGSGNIALKHYLKDINSRIRAVRRLDFTNGMRIDRTYEEHYQICQQLLQRNLPEAQKLMREHINHSENFVKNLTLTQLERARRGNNRNRST